MSDPFLCPLDEYLRGMSRVTSVFQEVPYVNLVVGSIVSTMPVGMNMEGQFKVAVQNSQVDPKIPEATRSVLLVTGLESVHNMALSGFSDMCQVTPES